MKSTNYRDTLITASPDSPVARGTVPDKPGTVAAVQHALLARPYAMTSDDLLHAAHRARGGDKSRGDFFAKPQACLRASPLVKQYGWGVHHDAEERIALLGMESDEYRRLLEDPAVAKVPGMRRAR
ncbi:MULTISPECIES: DUF6157 family protein [unclassified Sphingomonas]|jgi:Family of unknown function (DUF6157)|uniref:DUF6157 family protein n=1 Tax=unclassified Sphingomonas TaxID=196159 RepID=UPI000AD8F1AE|nr:MULTISPECIES: DUF6157 family protein [unclassified Sphingomonas]